MAARRRTDAEKNTRRDLDCRSKRDEGRLRQRGERALTGGHGQAPQRRRGRRGSSPLRHRLLSRGREHGSGVRCRGRGRGDGGGVAHLVGQTVECPISRGSGDGRPSVTKAIRMATSARVSRRMRRCPPARPGGRASRHQWHPTGGFHLDTLTTSVEELLAPLPSTSRSKATFSQSDVRVASDTSRATRSIRDRGHSRTDRRAHSIRSAAAMRGAC